MFVYAHVHAWGSENNICCHYSDTVCLVSETKSLIGLKLAREHWVRLAIELQELTSLYLPGSGFHIHSASLGCFNMGSGHGTQVLMTVKQVPTD